MAIPKNNTKPKKKKKSLLKVGFLKPTQEQDPTVFDPKDPLNIVKFFKNNPGTTVSDYNKYFGTNISSKEYGIFEKPKKKK